MAKEYVPIFFDWTEVTADLEADEKGHLIDAVVMYASGIRTAEEILESLGGMERVAFRFLKGQVDRNALISDARSKAGSNKKEQTETNENKEEQNGTKENKTEQTETKSVKEKEKEKDKEKDKENNNKDNKRFTPPALEEVEAYCKERGNKVNAQAWFDHYLANGWMVGKNKMKDWKATVRYWEHSGYDSGQKTAKKVSAQNYSQREYTEEELAGLTNNPINSILKQLYG